MPSLAGATLVVTRPASDAAALLRPIRALRGTPLPLPGLSLRASAAGATQLRAADRYHGWIFVSPAAVRFAFRAVPSLRPADGALICGVGAGTRRALARRGLAAVAPNERADSEGLLAVPELADVRGRRFALVGAPGGRELIATTLRARGAEVEPVHVYERMPPRWRARQLLALAQAPEPLITLLSSGEALSNLVARLPHEALQRLRRGALVVGSERLAASARANAFANVHVAASSLPADLLNAAQKVLARHRL